MYKREKKIEEYKSYCGIAKQTIREKNGRRQKSQEIADKYKRK